MATKEDQDQRVRDKAEDVEEEYGALADLYAEERSDAAEERGDIEGSATWRRVAEQIKANEDE